jgi:hypothetical protein
VSRRSAGEQRLNKNKNKVKSKGKVAELIKTNDHLTTLGLEKIKKIKEGMNKGR